MKFEAIKMRSSSLKRYISIVLLMVFSVQALASVGDIHKLHQSGENHVTFEHDHGDELSHDHNDVDIKKLATINFDKKTGTYDCHHCCHCHGIVFFGISSLPDIFFSHSFSTEPTHYVDSGARRSPNQQYRPPRA